MDPVPSPPGNTLEIILDYMPKTLYMLIGPKGSGKTYIGRLLDRRTDITFLRVEPIWLSLDPNEDGWIKVEEAIDREFENCDKSMIENLGVGDGFHGFLNSLKKRYEIKMIRVYADLNRCLERVKNRSNKDHIPLSDSNVEKYNKIASRVTFDWSLEIDNNGPATDAEILASFKNL